MGKLLTTFVFIFLFTCGNPADEPLGELTPSHACFLYCERETRCNDYEDPTCELECTAPFNAIGCLQERVDYLDCVRRQECGGAGACEPFGIELRRCVECEGATNCE